MTIVQRLLGAHDRPRQRVRPLVAAGPRLQHRADRLRRPADAHVGHHQRIPAEHAAGYRRRASGRRLPARTGRVPSTRIRTGSSASSRSSPATALDNTLATTEYRFQRSSSSVAGSAPRGLRRRPRSPRDRLHRHRPRQLLQPVEPVGSARTTTTTRSAWRTTSSARSSSRRASAFRPTPSRRSTSRRTRPSARSRRRSTRSPDPDVLRPLLGLAVSRQSYCPNCGIGRPGDRPLDQLALEHPGRGSSAIGDGVSRSA